MFSIIIPTFNNLDYLKLCLKSLKKNSNYEHDIIIFINEGNDGTLTYVKDNNLKLFCIFPIYGFVYFQKIISLELSKI